MVDEITKSTSMSLSQGDLNNKNSNQINTSGSYCVQQSAKDRVVFLSKKDLEKPIKPEYIKILERPSDEPGITLPNGQINWNCPCLGGMASGRCAVEFRSAFSCFHYSSSLVKGVECMQEFEKLQECMKKYPNLYPNDKKKDALNIDNDENDN